MLPWELKRLFGIEAQNFGVADFENMWHIRAGTTDAER
jgi:hypothetical protein